MACQGDRGGVITTGGGFSASIRAHSWQSATTTAYWATVATGNASSVPATGYNAEGRGYPDVSVIAVNYRVVIGGQWTGLYGTSASAPVFAGMIALINAQRLEAGRSSVGWINPTLYTYASNFTVDVDDGHNKCSAYGSVCCSQGFHAVSGWDPVTGLGVVNFTAMAAVFRSLATTAPSVAPSATPSVAPTTAAPNTTPPPTMASGYVYSYFYENDGCTGRVIAVLAYATQSCLPVYGASTSSILYYQRYSCSNGDVLRRTFSDSSCTVLLSDVSFALQTCSSVADSYYYFTGNDAAYSSLWQCTVTSSVNSLVPANGLTYLRNT